MFNVKNFKFEKADSKVVKVLVAVVVVVLMAYFLYPMWPKIQYHIYALVPNSNDLPITLENAITDAAVNDQTIPGSTDNEQTTVGNKLYIPKINVDTAIVEGETLDILNVYEGVWREPASSTPLVSGNMVLAGHRFQYLPPNTNTFYNLEEMQYGDDIYIYWEGRIFWYKVYETLLVNPDQVEVREPDPELVREITLYTCTPLYTSEKRFVVKASLIGYI
ncbi:sortase A [Patescibacteria group bacterium]|nr:class E sortase [Candidatus Dojkabacteria bacterium]MDL1872412.1 class E sortase [Deltaproteobacteria bacterium PRO3]CAG1023337.1 sortase A [Patescibacteria group bacterium]